MTARESSGRPEDRLLGRRDFTVTEIDESIGHFDFRRNHADHFGAIDRLRQVHQTAAFGIELSCRTL